MKMDLELTVFVHQTGVAKQSHVKQQQKWQHSELWKLGPMILTIKIRKLTAFWLNRWKNKFGKRCRKGSKTGFEMGCCPVSDFFVKGFWSKFSKTISFWTKSSVYFLPNFVLYHLPPDRYTPHRFAIFWEIFENCELKTLENVFENTNHNDLVVGTVC